MALLTNSWPLNCFSHLATLCASSRLLRCPSKTLLMLWQHFRGPLPTRLLALWCGLLRGLTASWGRRPPVLSTNALSWTLKKKGREIDGSSNAIIGNAQMHWILVLEAGHYLYGKNVWRQLQKHLFSHLWMKCFSIFPFLPYLFTLYILNYLITSKLATWRLFPLSK